MVQSQTQPVRRIAFPILIALSVSHCLNDLLQSVISAVYPLFKEDLSLSFDWIDNPSLPDVCFCISTTDRPYF